jgi:hypothetical protein
MVWVLSASVDQENLSHKLMHKRTKRAEEPHALPQHREIVSPQKKAFSKEDGLFDYQTISTRYMVYQNKFFGVEKFYFEKTVPCNGKFLPVNFDLTIDNQEKMLSGFLDPGSFEIQHEQVEQPCQTIRMFDIDRKTTVITVNEHVAVVEKKNVRWKTIQMLIYEHEAKALIMFMLSAYDLKNGNIEFLNGFEVSMRHFFECVTILKTFFFYFSSFGTFRS